MLLDGTPLLRGQAERAGEEKALGRPDSSSFSVSKGGEGCKKEGDRLSTLYRDR